jgi:4-hydroxy-3-polyprenylbenzoate decarboxylase
VIWAITTRVDDTPIDYQLRFPRETRREWGCPMQMIAEVTAKVDKVWQTLGL